MLRKVLFTHQVLCLCHVLSLPKQFFTQTIFHPLYSTFPACLIVSIFNQPCNLQSYIKLYKHYYLFGSLSGSSSRVIDCWKRIRQFQLKKKKKKGDKAILLYVFWSETSEQSFKIFFKTIRLVLIIRFINNYVKK